MFKFKATLEVSSIDQVNKLLESMLLEKLSKRTANDFLISFDKSELNVELNDVDLTEKLASALIGCGTVKKCFIENQAKKKNESEKENLGITEKKPETKSEESEPEPAQEPESESEETEAEPAQEPESESEKSEPEPAQEPESKSEESEPEPAQESEGESEESEPEPAQELESKSEESEPEPTQEPESESEQSEPEPTQEPESKSEESEPEPAQELKSELEDSEKNAEDVITEELSTEYILKIYEEAGANTKKFCEMLADYVQIPDNNRTKKAFYELIEAVIETEKMSWFCIENRIKNNAKQFYEKAYYNNNTKLLISISIKKKFNLTLLKFLKQIKDAIEGIVTSEKNEELNDVSISEEAKTDINSEKVIEESKAEEKVEVKKEIEAEPESEENIKNEAETESVSEEISKKEAEVELEPEENAEKEAKVGSVSEESSKKETEVKPESKEENEKPKEVESQTEVIKQTDEKDEDVFDEYWSGIFKCMPKIITKDASRIQKVSKKEKQFLAIDKSQPISSRIKEILEIMEEFNLVADESFITFSEQIFTKAPVIKIEKSTPLYQKMRLLQWSKSLQRFVQKYYTNDPNFRVNVDKFLEEVREMIMTPEEIKKVK